MIEPLLALPAHQRSRLAKALSSLLLSAPYTEAAIRSALAGAAGDIAAIRDTLATLHAQGFDGRAIALALNTATQAAAGASRPDLVWSGPTAPGINTRNTRQVYDELIASAHRSIWISTYAYYDGKHAFKSLADRLVAIPGLKVTILLNIARKPSDQAPGEQIAAQFADKFWSYDWPGPIRPAVYYDPRSLQPDGPAGVLHAKAIVVDDDAVFVTSANLTQAAFDHNIEVGILSRDAQLATSLARHFRLLIEHGPLRSLP